MKTRTELLDKADIDLLKYRLRPGIIFPIMLMFIFMVLLVFIAVYNPPQQYTSNPTEFIFLGAGIILAFNLLVAYLLLRKPLKDLKSGEKTVIEKIISKKEEIVSYEAGSGTMYFGQKMKQADVFAIIVDHTRYKVEKDIFDNSEEGKTIKFHYSKPGAWLIRIGGG